MTMNKEEQYRIEKLLNEALIKHYVCFNEERFYLDKVTDYGVFITTTSISDACPIKLCTWIAKFVKKFYAKICQPVPDWIYIGAWAFKTSKL